MMEVEVSVERRRVVRRLTNLCIDVLLSHLDDIADVGDVDGELLKRVLSHCNAEQLQRIEDSTIINGRDLTPITDSLWKGIYTRKYGVANVYRLIAKMKTVNMRCTWRELLRAKALAEEETQQRCVDRLKQLYQEADKKKQSRRVQVCEVLPPQGRKRKQDGSSNWSNNYNGRINLHKARMQCASSNVARVKEEIKSKPLNYSPP
eukprot:TRINITY_DN5409_c0_g1_i2.p1 TRINITY_DN5409_c0_g1~~TRINITY_DN5409_c0_g1_i2.p1  ORF type:complete len:205 (-),score=33.70 TRINITY_DN5409_c0_g1_i2:93-707(-)